MTRWCHTCCCNPWWRTPSCTPSTWRADLESRLDPQRFVRVHRGDVVALDAVVSVEPLTHGDAVVTLKSGAAVRVSRRYGARLPDRSG